LYADEAFLDEDLKVLRSLGGSMNVDLTENFEQQMILRFLGGMMIDFEANHQLKML
jgi:hypothetical protein